MSDNEYDKHYDVVVVGAGISGSIVARQLAEAGKTVLVLEAGVGDGLNADGYRSFVSHFHGQKAKVPNSPYPANANAPSPEAGALGDNGYWIQEGPVAYGSDYLRAGGGTTMHFLGTFLRMMPNDFELWSTYEKGRDWPIGYDDLTRYYRMAELEGGVAADVRDQEYGERSGFDEPQVPFAHGYEYPMHRIPQSYWDQWLAKAVGDMRHAPGAPTHADDYAVRVVSTPQARNGMPNPRYVDPRTGRPFEPVGMVGDRERGKRCEGNSSCIPICPVQAKYNALKTLDVALQTGRVDFQPMSVVSELDIDELSGRVWGVTYKQYHDPSDPAHRTRRARGTIVVLAAHAVENAKILLASDAGRTPHMGAANESGQVGQNLMDHPFLLAWGTTPEPVGSYRGPGATSGLPTMRDGPFREDQAAFRAEIGNWGWTLSANAPFLPVRDMVDNEGLLGKALRDRIHHDFPRHVRIGFLLEQLPIPENRVRINPDPRKQLDPLGIRRPIIDYRYDEYTKKGLTAAARFWVALRERTGIQPSRLASMPRYDPFDGDEDVEPFALLGSGHLAGTHIMGSDRNTSVVDSYQRSWDHENLYLVGCGSMTTVGTSNPTLTMAALAFRSAEKIIRDLEGASIRLSRGPAAEVAS